MPETAGSACEVSMHPVLSHQFEASTLTNGGMCVRRSGSLELVYRARPGKG